MFEIKKKIFGLDISDHSIEAIVLEKPFFGKPKIVSYARTLLKAQIVRDGVIKNPQKLAESIVKLLRSAKPAPITTPFCILSLPESQVFSTIFKLPAGLKHNEVRNTIPYKAEEIIPFDSTEIYFDFKTITIIGTAQEIFYAAVPTKIVDSYVAVLREIGLKPIGFDIESISLARALVDNGRKPDKAKLIIDIGARTTNLNIFDRNGIRQSLTLKIAGNHFTRALATSLKLTAKEADGLKMKVGLDDKNPETNAVIVLKNQFKKIITETKKFIDFYQDETKRQVGEIILAGGSSLLPKVDQYLADALKIETNLGRPLVKVNDPGNLVKLKNKAILFADVIGLGLRGVSRNPADGDINLLPIRFKTFTLAPDRGEKKAWVKIYIRAFTLVVLLVFLLSLISLRRQGLDLYQKIFPQPKYIMVTDSDVDPQALQQLRNSLPSPTEVASTTPSTFEQKIKIKQIAGGQANVRQGPGVNFSKVGQTESGQEYKFLEEQNGWTKIELDPEIQGWVKSEYVDKLP
jgi:type IV pilus assembly protein PilM